MKRDLIMGWVFIALSLLMVFCVIVNIVNQNWAVLPICGFAFGMNITSAINRFRDYKQRKEWDTAFVNLDEGIRVCWPEYDEDRDSDENKITD